MRFENVACNLSAILFRILFVSLRRPLLLVKEAKLKTELCFNEAGSSGSVRFLCVGVYDFFIGCDCDTDWSILPRTCFLPSVLIGQKSHNIFKSLGANNTHRQLPVNARLCILFVIHQYFHDVGPCIARRCVIKAKHLVGVLIRAQSTWRTALVLKCLHNFNIVVADALAHCLACHQNQWYWLCGIGRPLASMRKDSKFLCHISTEES